MAVIPPLWWQPDTTTVEKSNLNAFRQVLNETFELNLQSYEEIHSFSVGRLEDFWSTFWWWSRLRAQKDFTVCLKYRDALPEDVPKFFEGARLNLAENILFPSHPMIVASSSASSNVWPHDDHTAIFECGEAACGDDGGQSTVQQMRRVTWGELRRRVAILSETLRRRGCKIGDRVVHISGNSSHPIVTFLSCLSVGCIFSALPIDAGHQALYTRLAQLQPKVLFLDCVTQYKGKIVDASEKIARVIDELIEDKKADRNQVDLVCIVNCQVWTEAEGNLMWTGTKTTCKSLSDYVSSTGLSCIPSNSDVPKLRFQSLAFDHPALIVFSSGTTGEPKAICHSTGGILLNGKKEGLFQYEMKGTEDTFLQITSCGWIMWLAQVSMLLVGSSIVTYDGSPIFPDAFAIPVLISNHPFITGLGCSPRLLSIIAQACLARGITKLRENFPMNSLRIATSTGSALSSSNAKFFYESLASPHTQLMSISGGTDVAGCLVGSSSLLPVQGHLIGSKSLGIDVRIVHPLTGEDCEESGDVGELAVARPFPNQPLYFWGKSQDRDSLLEKYMNSYYRRFVSGPARGWWVQGDLISRRLGTDAFEIHGRSDGVLNPSGVRFGSAEIYSVVESGRFPFVADSIVVGQRRPNDDDESLLLFIKCKKGEKLSGHKRGLLSRALKSAYSARHVPKYIFQVADIPVTTNGKKMESAVKAIVSGNTEYSASSAIANADALTEYKQYANVEAVLLTTRASNL